MYDIVRLINDQAVVARLMLFEIADGEQMINLSNMDSQRHQPFRGHTGTTGRCAYISEGEIVSGEATDNG